MPKTLKFGLAIVIFAMLTSSQAFSQTSRSTNSEKALRGVWKLRLPGRARSAEGGDVEIRLQFNGIEAKGTGRCSMGGNGHVAGDRMTVSAIAEDVLRRAKTGQGFAGGAFGGRSGQYRFLDANQIMIEMIGTTPEKGEISIAGNRLTTRFGNGRLFVWIKDQKASRELARIYPVPDTQQPSPRGELANQTWSDFLVKFRAAVAKRDRAALREMIATPFMTQVDGEFHTPDDVINWLGQSNLWRELQEELRPGARFTDPGGQGLQKCASDGIFCFKLEPDGRWRLSEQSGND